jgi:uncharacterized protein (DUF983 family)
MARKTRKADQALYPELSVISTGIAARCPRCGEGRLYASILKPVRACSICGLDMSFAEEGDGPAVLVILLLGGVIAGLAIALENLVHPPVWIHVVVWLPVTLMLSVLALRAMKGIMIAAQYKTRAAEGRLDKSGKRK